MNEARLREMLREAPLPGAAEAERRGLALATAAFRQRAEAAPARRRRRSSPRRLALAIVVAALATGLLLSLASASVRHWVGDVFSAGVPKAHPGLAEIPGGGRLLVQSARGPWVVQADGSRRLLGDYGEATWSPNGLFVAAAAGRTLSAVEPNGTPRWSLTAPGPVTKARWSPGKYRIAYRAGNQLRVTAADGTGDRRLARGTAPVAPAWEPGGAWELAYATGGGPQRAPRLRIADTESREPLGSAPALSGLFELEWGDRGRSLLEASRSALRLRPLRFEKVELAIGIGAGTRLPLPAGARVEDAALAPRGGTVAAVVRTGHGRRARSSLLVYRGAGAPRSLLTVPGRLSQVFFSPDSRRLLVAWPEADEWLFLPLGGGKGRAVGDVSSAFAPGSGAPVAFPQVEGWCCSVSQR